MALGLINIGDLEHLFPLEQHRAGKISCEIPAASDFPPRHSALEGEVCVKSYFGVTEKKTGE